VATAMADAIAEEMPNAREAAVADDATKEAAGSATSS